MYHFGASTFIGCYQKSCVQNDQKFPTLDTRGQEIAPRGSNFKIFPGGACPQTPLRMALLRIASKKSAFLATNLCQYFCEIKLYGGFPAKICPQVRGIPLIFRGPKWKSRTKSPTLSGGRGCGIETDSCITQSWAPSYTGETSADRGEIM